MKKIIIIFLVTILLLSSGCEIQYRHQAEKDGWKEDTEELFQGEIFEKSYTFDESVEKLSLSLETGIGELKIKSGKDHVLSADFDYSKKEWAPDVWAKTEEKEAHIRIKQPSFKETSGFFNSLINVKKVRNRWDIKIDKKTPIDIKLESGVGDANLDLSDLKLRALSISCGVGNVKVDMNKAYESNVEVSVEGGVGNITLYVPKDMGVRVKVNRGIGDLDIDGFIKYDDTYLNRAYEEEDKHMDIKVEMGVGNVKVIEK